MALRLQLDNGEIKEYCTVSSWGGWYGDFYHTPGCETKCGMKWDPRRKPDEEGCSHLDCAIHILEQNIKSFYIFIVFLIIGLLLVAAGGADVKSVILYGGSILSFFLIVGSWDLYRESKKKGELIEFRDHGTIKGVTANKI